MSTATKERPALFNGEMVRAIMSGAKTQTRRIVKPQPDPWIDQLHGDDLRGRAPYEIEHPETGATVGFGFQSEDTFYKCPYGTVGDLLRISEPVDVSAESDECYSLHFPADGHCAVRYGSPDLIEKIRSYKTGRLRGVHLPPAYARLDRLLITDIRVERLQDISDDDAIAEGSQCAGVPASITNRGAFGKLWESINGRGSWDANPWLWVVEFRRLEAG